MNLKDIPLKSVHFKLRDPRFFQNCGHFQYNQLNQNKVSWCYIENDHNFERNDDRATVFLK